MLIHTPQNGVVEQTIVLCEPCYVTLLENRVFAINDIYIGVFIICDGLIILGKKFGLK